MTKKKTDEILGTFKELAFYGFKTLPNGKIMPYSERIHTDEIQRKNQFDMIQLQVNTGQLDSINISGGYISIQKNQKIPGELSKYLDEDFSIILPFSNLNIIPTIKENSKVSVSKTLTNNGKNYYQITKIL